MVICLFPGCREKDPQIDAIYPRIGKMGEVLTIRGAYFGENQEESYVTVAGFAPTTTAYITWRDDLISLTIPEFAEAGLVYVHRGNKKSNAALFSNEETIPKPIFGADAETGPRIISINPKSAPIGGIVTITGNNFGISREGSSVWFTWGVEASSSAPAELIGPASVEVLENDFGYEVWGEREIRVRVPDGAMSGNLEIRTARGNSRPNYFEVSEKPGIKTFRNKLSYAISYSVDIQVQEASSANTLYLWLPQPVNSASQRLGEPLSRREDPFIENYRGLSLYKLKDLETNKRKEIAVSYPVEVYTVETSVRSREIRQNRPASLYAAYTAPSPLIPGDDPRIKRQASSIAGREQNPYLKAQLIYRWLISEGGIKPGPLTGDALDALANKQADPYQAALLFCALARAEGIPAIPAAGILVDQNSAAVRHYWAEFWIDGFGWIPVDPALGAGACPAKFNLAQENGEYYFGNLDNQRVTFSRGEVHLTQMESQGRTSGRERYYAIQNLWEEAVGGLESYSSLWNDIVINGIYQE
ncbi:MAG: IPT/TIG domain-containing protein [Treponema sp.]|nr:IPT/TIG domain-containing protein [Treponema sp.]